MKAKLERAILWMGSKYVMHPSRRVCRLKPGAQIDLHRTDVAATFKRVAKRAAT